MEQSLASFAEWFRQLYHLDKPDVRQYSALTLAYIGDAVYEIIIRSYVVGRGNAQVEKLHKRSSRLVKAKTQADLIKAVAPQLTEEERAVYKRGRNAKSYTMAKNATMSDYRHATGCEALIGYLYLSERYERLTTLIHEGLTALSLIDA
jgi:ribonuclease-3 family protein